MMSLPFAAKGSKLCERTLTAACLLLAEEQGQPLQGGTGARTFEIYLSARSQQHAGSTRSCSKAQGSATYYMVCRSLYVVSAHAAQVYESVLN